MLGTVQRVLIEKVSDKDPNLLIGTADNTRLVSFIGDPAWVGRLQRLKLPKLKL